MLASELTVSTSSSAAWPAASIARRIAPMSEVTPVEVSLWTASTARYGRSARSPRSRASISSGGNSWPQRNGTSSTSKPRLRAVWAKPALKWPLLKASTRSPGARTLTSAASQAPVPEAG
jgi:hypothetical protein